MSGSTGLTRGLVALAVLAAVGLAMGLVVSRGGAIPDGPVPIAWDREPCAHCRMQIGSPRHAAQLVTDTGEVFAFDDVGCAIDFIRRQGPVIHRLWFHGEGERWLAREEAAFGDDAMTPMGSGLVAVERGTPGARSWDEVLATHRHPSAHRPTGEMR